MKVVNCYQPGDETAGVGVQLKVVGHWQEHFVVILHRRY
jgi:hypothetical protein